MKSPKKFFKGIPGRISKINSRRISEASLEDVLKTLPKGKDFSKEIPGGFTKEFRTILKEILEK